MLHVQALSGHVVAAKALIDAGCRVSARLTDGRSALHIAAVNEHVPIMRLLLDKSAANAAALAASAAAAGAAPAAVPGYAHGEGAGEEDGDCSDDSYGGEGDEGDEVDEEDIRPKLSKTKKVPLFRKFYRHYPDLGVCV